MSQQHPQTPTDPNPTSPSLAVDPPARPASYLSSGIIDIPSEDGESVARSPLSTHPSQSRRGPPPARNSFISSSHGGTSRPPSAASRMSRTHVPALASNAFFRPMSSQRLQAQRSARPANQRHQAATPSEDGHSDVASNKRHSFISTTTSPPRGPTPQENELLPPSRGTEFTDPGIDRAASASPTGNTTIRSLGDSVRLLNDKSQRPAGPPQLNVGSYNSNGAVDPPQRSPLSFRSGFLNASHSHHHLDSTGHERLSSNASTPRKPTGGDLPTKQDLGKNFEYFLGNNIFFAGGRLQNSRDRPVNIATGLFVLLPAGLFFGYSYVPPFRPN
jgi:palmitoyltransferase ZDHHC9/14/18